MEHIVKIRSIMHVTHDVLQIITKRPPGYDFIPGQATDVSINKTAWKNEKRPFTFTSRTDDNYLEFTIKTYPSRLGVTNQLLRLQENDELILHEVFGDIRYKGEGVFIAGGAGVTPFLAILKDLDSRHETGNNRLIFANKTRADIIHEKLFSKLLGENFINVLSDEKAGGYEHGFINAELLSRYIPGSGSFIYLCGPPPMMDAVEKQLAALGIGEERIVREAF